MLGPSVFGHWMLTAAPGKLPAPWALQTALSRGSHETLLERLEMNMVFFLKPAGESICFHRKHKKVSVL